MEVIIEPARADDLPAVLALLERSDLPAAGLAEHFAAALVAREGSLVVGSAALELYGGVALLRSIAVAPERRAGGLGKQLVAAALDLARRQGVAQVYLLTETAADFFPRFGFRAIARADVAPAVRRSAEFTDACPESAAVLRLAL